MMADLRSLPQVNAVLDMPEAETLLARFSREEVVSAVRAEIARLRKALLAGDSSGPIGGTDAAFFEAVETHIDTHRLASLRPVINATGVIIHTNLGRAPLAPEAVAAMRAIAGGYANLELDLTSGERGSRQGHVERLLCQLTGAEAALVLNNCSATVVASLAALAGGQTVIASRGELVEIGGSFRMPDVITASGARLKEVGATNKTHLSDYADAIDDQTAVLLKSHTSNFKQVGFTTAPSRKALAELARETGTIFMEDLGSGVLIDLAPFGMTDEPVVRDVVSAGADLVMFSGDKLLGGPQAGIIVGQKDVVSRIAKHPMARAMRIDKLSLAGLEATLRLYLPPHDPRLKIPVLQMLAMRADVLEKRAYAVVERLKTAENVLRSAEETRILIVPTIAYAGGGSLPEQDLESFGLSLERSDMRAVDLARRLRGLDLPILGRISNDKIIIDLRTVLDSDLDKLVEGLLAALTR